LITRYSSSGSVHVTHVDTAGNDLVVGLQENGAVAEVVEEGDDGRLDVEGVEPKGEDTCFALAFGIEVFDLLLLLLGDGVQTRVGVEQVRNKGKVELRVTGHERGRGKELAALELVGVLQDLFSSLKQVRRLKWAS
jgi:hypothetical protein